MSGAPLMQHLPTESYRTGLKTFKALRLWVRQGRQAQSLTDPPLHTKADYRTERSFWDYKTGS